MRPARRWLVLAGLTAPLSALLYLLGVPSPALFAGLAVATGLALADRAPGSEIPRAAVTGAQAVIGVVIGVLANGPGLAAVAADWVPVALVGAATLGLSMAAGLLLGLHHGVSPLTGVLALTAGGASGLTAISRDLGGDERLVVVVQYLRVGLVTATMPLVAALWFGARAGTGPVEAAGSPGPAVPWYVGLAVLAACCAVGLPLARVTRLPAGGLLGPMIVALAVSLTGIAPGAGPPTIVVEVAYAVIGWQAGMRFTPASLRTVAQVLPSATALILGVVAGCGGLGALLAHLTGASALEGYLATTPGGIYAVLATTISAGGDVAFVVAVQVLRVVLMLLVAPVVARLVSRLG